MTIPLLIYAVYIRDAEWNSRTNFIMNAFSILQVITSLILAMALIKITRVVKSLERVELNKRFIAVLSIIHCAGVIVSAFAGLILAYYQYEDI